MITCKLLSRWGACATVFGLACLNVGSVFSKPPENFIYGVQGDAFDSALTPHPLMAAFGPADQGSKFTQRMSMLMDTLGFNMALNRVYNQATAESVIGGRKVYRGAVQKGG